MVENKTVTYIVILVVSAAIIYSFYSWLYPEPHRSQEANLVLGNAFEIMPGIGCGDGYCESDEDCSNCPEDCGECPIEPPPEPPENESTISIAAWNLQVFGPSKASNELLMPMYVDIMNDFDIIVVQEIRDASGEAFEKLCDMMEGYECEISERTGRSTSKEQYGVVYKNVDLQWTRDLYEEQESWERPPFIAKFEAGAWEFVLMTIHTKPDDVLQELVNLEQWFSRYPVSDPRGLDDARYAYLPNYDFIIMGDLNADCDYYDREKNPTFEEWNWAIPDDADTTVAATDCAYDRIIYNERMGNNFIEYGINGDITSDLSDHYLIWTTLKPDPEPVRCTENAGILTISAVESALEGEETITPLLCLFGDVMRSGQSDARTFLKLDVVREISGVDSVEVRCGGSICSEEGDMVVGTFRPYEIGPKDYTVHFKIRVNCDVGNCVLTVIDA